MYNNQLESAPTISLSSSQMAQVKTQERNHDEVATVWASW